MSTITTPVRYNERREVLVDANDVGLAGALTHRPEAEYIAKCINSHESLTAQLAALRAKVAEYEAMVDASDSIIFNGDESIEYLSDGTWKLQTFDTDSYHATPFDAWKTLRPKWKSLQEEQKP